MKTVVISGKMGVGKSFLAQKISHKKYFPYFDFPVFVVEVDTIGHFFLQKKFLHKPLFRIFGKNFSNRKKIRYEIWKNPKKLTQLENLLHPYMQKKIGEIQKKYHKKKGTIVFPCALPHIFFPDEKNIITLKTPFWVQFLRLKKRNLSCAEIFFFLKKQEKQEEKEKQKNFPNGV